MISIMANIFIELSLALGATGRDNISGRKEGEIFGAEQKLLELALMGNKIILRIDDSRIKAINDSFIKGVFSPIFAVLKTRSEVAKYFEVEGNDYYKRLFSKNWMILEAVEKQ